MKQFLKDHDARSFVRRHPTSIGFVVCMVLIFGTVVYVAVNNAKTTKALCALRADQENTVRASKAFLATHPNGVLGLSAVAIRQGIANRERTVHALRFLSC